MSDIELPEPLQQEADEMEEQFFGDLEEREMQDVEDIDTGDYPEAAQENARMALDAKEETGNPNDCGTQVGWERANQLDNGENLSEDTINRMAQFERHEDNKEQGEEGNADCGWMMWKAWGGDEGIEWAQDKVDEFEEAREASEGRDTDFSHYEDWEKSLQEMHSKLWDADGQTRVLNFVESATPQFVKDRIRDTLMSGALFSDIEAIPSSDRMQLREFMTETLTSDGWTVDGLSDQIEQLGVDPQRADTIARTETASVLNQAREEGYEEQGMGDSLFYWTGAKDSRTTDACRWLINETNPFEGGEPVPMDELKELIEEAPTHDPEMDDNVARPEDFVVHIGERKSFARAPPDMT